jgi:hypothetical protein
MKNNKNIASRLKSDEIFYRDSPDPAPHNPAFLISGIRPDIGFGLIDIWPDIKNSRISCLEHIHMKIKKFFKIKILKI